MNEQISVEHNSREKLKSALPGAIRALRLTTIYADGSTSLVSLAHRFVLADAEDLWTPEGTTHLDMTEDLERQITEAAGEKYDGSWPGWEAVFDYLNGTPNC